MFTLFRMKLLKNSNQQLLQYSAVTYLVVNVSFECVMFTSILGAA